MLLGPTGYPLAASGKLATWPFTLDPDHPESQGLQALAIATPFGFYDLKQGLLATRTGVADAFTASQYGGLDAAYNSSADGHLFPAGKALDYTQPFTIVWEAQLNSFAVNYPEICTIYGGGTNLSLLLFYSNQAGYSDLTIGKSNDVSTLQYNAQMPSGVSVTGERHWGVWSYIGGGFGTTANHSCWINGQDANIPGHPGGLASVTDQTTIGGISSTTWWDGQIRQLRWYDRAWAKDEAIAFWHPATRDSIFVPGPRGVWNRGSGITYTLTATKATFAETGVATAFLRGRVVSAATAAFTETGNTTGLLRNRAITAAVAAFSLSGLPTIVAWGRFLSTAVGGFTTTGIAANFTIGRFISAALGAFGLTAQPASLFRHRVVSAVTSAFALTGVASALSHVRTLAAATAAFSLVGKVVALSKSALGGASAAQIWQYEILPGVTAEQLLRLAAAVLFGKVSGAGTSTEVFRDINDTKDRVTVTVDASGNRTGVTLDSS